MRSIQDIPRVACVIKLHVVTFSLLANVTLLNTGKYFAFSLRRVYTMHATKTYDCCMLSQES